MMELPILDYSVLHNDSIVETGSVHRVIQSHHSLSLKSVGSPIGQSKIRLGKLGGTKADTAHFPQNQKSKID